jgi:hypothetical protein
VKPGELKCLFLRCAKPSARMEPQQLNQGVAAMAQGDWGTGEKLFGVEVPGEIASRGTGEQVVLNEACVFDFMPPLVGSRFMLSPALQQRVYYGGAGEQGMPLMDAMQAYSAASEEALRAGDVDDALGSYQCSLRAATIFTRYMHGLQDVVLLNTRELGALGFAQYSRLEAALQERIAQTDAGYNPGEYAAFVREIRTDQGRERELNGLFFQGFSSHMERNEAFEPAVAQECTALLAKMGRFKQAASYAEHAGLTEEAAAYRARVGEEPGDSERARRHLQRVRDQREAREIARGY